MIKIIFGKQGPGISIHYPQMLKRQLNNNEITPEQYTLLRLLHKLEKQEENEYNQKLIQDIKQKLKDITK